MKKYFVVLSVCMAYSASFAKYKELEAVKQSKGYLGTPYIFELKLGTAGLSDIGYLGTPYIFELKLGTAGC
jgi:hypothetical protein